MGKDKITNTDQILIALGTADWSGIMLAELRNQALAEETGIKTLSLREEGGSRLVFVVCLTSPADIAKFQALPGVTDAPVEDWSALSLASLVEHGVRSQLMLLKAERNRTGSQTAVALIAADENSVRILEALFTI